MGRRYKVADVPPRGHRNRRALRPGERGDAALNEMTPPSGIGKRSSVEFYDVAVLERQPTPPDIETLGSLT
jgi:hypothetical protein